MTFRACAALTLTIALFVAGSATAGPARSKEKDEERAVELILDAQKLQEAARHDQALKLLEDAWALFPHPKVLFFKARSLMALGRYDEARSTYRLIRSNVRDLQPDKLKEIDANLALCDQKLAAAAAPKPLDPKQQVVAHPTPPAVVVTDLRPKAPPLPVAGATTTARDRTWGWVTLGSGIALTAGGLAFLGNHLYYQSQSLAPNQHLEGGGLDLGLGASMTGLGLAAVGTGLYLLIKEPSTPVAGVVPLEGGALFTIGGGL